MSVKSHVAQIAVKDEHLVMRIGMAAVYQWDSLSNDVQELLLQQATFVSMGSMTERLDQQIAMFIEENKNS